CAEFGAVQYVAHCGAYAGRLCDGVDWYCRQFLSQWRKFSRGAVAALPHALSGGKERAQYKRVAELMRRPCVCETLTADAGDCNTDCQCQPAAASVHYIRSLFCKGRVEGRRARAGLPDGMFRNWCAAGCRCDCLVPENSLARAGDGLLRTVCDGGGDC